jgi:hypothetical protein
VGVGGVCLVLGWWCSVKHRHEDEALMSSAMMMHAPAASSTVQTIRLMLSILPPAIYIVHSLTPDESRTLVHMS